MTDYLYLKYKLRFHSFLCMVMLLFIHNGNLSMKVVVPDTMFTDKLDTTSFLEYFLANCIFRYRLPLLMAISGYLFTQSGRVPYYKMVIKRFKALMIPYVLVSIIALLLTIIFEFIILGPHPRRTNGILGYKSVLNFSPKDYFHYIFIFPIAFQLWYLKSLFFLNISTPFLKLALEKAPIIVLGGFVLAYFTTHIFDWNSSLSCIIYFVLGYYLGLTKVNIIKPINIFPIWPTALFYVAISVARTLIAFSNQPQTGVWPSKDLLYFLFKVNEVLGMYTAWFGLDALFMWFVSKKWFSKVTGASFFIYAFHAPLMLFINKIILDRFSHVPNMSLMAFTILPMLIIFFLVWLDFVVKKNLPNFYNLVTGGRGFNMKR